LTQRPTTSGYNNQQKMNSGRKEYKNENNEIRTNFSKLLNTTLCIKPTIKIKLNRNNFFTQNPEIKLDFKPDTRLPKDSSKVKKINNIINRYTAKPNETYMRLADRNSNKRPSAEQPKLSSLNNKRFSIQPNVQQSKESCAFSSLRNSFVDLINQTFTSKYPSNITIGVSQHSYFTKAGQIQSNDKINQDSFIIATNLNSNPNINLFGVADGHGQFGHEVSQIIKACLPGSLNRICSK